MPASDTPTDVDTNTDTMSQIPVCLLFLETQNVRGHNWPTRLFEDMNSNNRNIPSDNDDGSFLAESYSQAEGGHNMDSGSWRHPHEESYDDEYVEGMLSLRLFWLERIGPILMLA